MSTEKKTETRTRQPDELDAMRAELEALKAEKKAREKADAEAQAKATRQQADDERRIKVFAKIRRDQPSQLWDAKRGKLLAEFDRAGVCRTNDPKAVKELRKLGYPEVPVGSRPMPTPLAEPDPFAAGFIKVN